MHLLIPFAAIDDPASRQTLRSLRLPHLTRLLTRLTPQPAEAGTDDSPALPHEHALATAMGLDPLAPPWAALQAHDLGLEGAREDAWAFITPSHWQVGQAQVTLLAPEELALAEDESRTLLAAMQPYFETYGITLHYAAPTRWLAEGELFRDLPSASLDRVLGRNVDPWLPGGVPGRAMRLLQNEMQMLLYTHAVNDTRAAGRQLAVNSFWISGSGALPDTFHARVPPDTTVSRSLAQATFSDDWTAYTQAWTALDASEGARLLALQQGGAAVRLSLCGERNALTFETTSTGIFSRMKSLFGQQPLSVLLEQL